MAARKKRVDDKWEALLHEAYEVPDSVPEEAKLKLVKLTDAICNLGEEYQIHPRAMVALIGATMGHLSLVEVGGNVHANKHFDDFVEFGHAAIHVAVASARLRDGWTPGGAN